MDVALEIDRALDSVQRIGELGEDSIPDRLDLATVMDLKKGPKPPLLLLDQAKRSRFIDLGEGSVPHDVGEHDGSESTGAGHEPRSRCRRLNAPILQPA